MEFYPNWKVYPGIWKRCYKDSNNRLRIFMFYRNCTKKKIKQWAVCGEFTGGELGPFLHWIVLVPGDLSFHESKGIQS